MTWEQTVREALYKLLGCEFGEVKELDQDVDTALNAIRKATGEAIGEDQAITIGGQEFHDGDKLTIDFSGGVGSASFRESAIALEINGRNGARKEVRNAIGLKQEQPKL